MPSLHSLRVLRGHQMAFELESDQRDLHGHQTAPGSDGLRGRALRLTFRHRISQAERRASWGVTVAVP
jgi:hypothetical protein